MSLYKKLTTSFVLLLLSLSSASAWDGKRQGFVLGLGAGYGNIDYTDVQSVHLDSNSRSDKVGAITFMPKLGYAFTDSFSLLYFRHPFELKAKDPQGGTQTLVACVEQVGFNYYFGDKDPSFYIGAGTGKSYFFKGADNQSDTALHGGGSFYSIGYEFATHYSIELTSMQGTLDNNQGQFKGMGLTLNVLGY